MRVSTGPISLTPILRNANLDRADLSRARLMRADLSGANLGQAKGLMEGQLFGSIGNGLTVLPPHVERPETWPDLGGETSRRAPSAGSKRDPIAAHAKAHELALGRGQESEW